MAPLRQGANIVTLQVSGYGRLRRPEKIAVLHAICIISNENSGPKPSKFSCLRRKMVAVLYDHNMDSFAPKARENFAI